MYQEALFKYSPGIDDSNGCFASQVEQVIGQQDLLSLPLNLSSNPMDQFNCSDNQHWCLKSSYDSAWCALTKLKEELMNQGLLNPNSNRFRRVHRDWIKEKEEREKLIKTVKFLLVHFNNFNSPQFGIITLQDWANASFDEIQITKNAANYMFIKQDKLVKMRTLLYQILQLLSENKFITKGGLYHLNKDHYDNQKSCEELVEDLCCITHQPSKSFHIISCPTGLIYGRVTFSIDGVEYDCTKNNYGLTISQDVELIEEIKSDAKFILVVDKEDSFQYLINENISGIFPSIMLTGKGLPDADTRRLLKILADSLAIPVLGLIDADPHGIEILCIYRYGFMMDDRQSHLVPQLRWLGFHPTDIDRWQMPKSFTNNLNGFDQKKLLELESRPCIVQNRSWAQQIAFLKNHDIKAQLQTCSNLVGTYLADKIENGDWI